MREILFRGKRIDNGEWKEGYYAAEPYIKNTYNYGYILENEKDLFAKKAWLVDSRTVGQFTGLTDKNGKKIFEGDICNINIPRIDGEFSTHNNCLCSFEYGKFMFSSYSDIYFCVGDGYGYHDTCNKNIEVIGNIHDNLGLLEATE